MNVVMRSLATANPPRYASQEYIYEFLRGHFKLCGWEEQLYHQLLVQGPIRGRYIGVDFDEQICAVSADEQVSRFLKFGTMIGTQAARKAIEQAQLSPGDIGAIVVNTCTGYLCPGLSSYIAEEIGLSNSVKAIDLMGMGCGAAIPNLETAANIVMANPDSAVLSVSVEICSATLFMGADPALIVSNSIFGDGAAAAILARPGNGKALMRLCDFSSALFPKYRRHLHYRTEEGRLRNVLSVRVPVLGGRVAGHACQELFGRHGLKSEDVDHWAVHPGGTTILDEIAGRLGLNNGELRHSRKIFEEYGNMSSPSVLFVLRHILDEMPSPGSTCVLLAFGAGFSGFAALGQIE